MTAKTKKQQVEDIQIDFGIVYVNYGEVDAYRLGPTRGGAGFKAEKSIRNIEFDGQRGKTKGTQVIETIEAMLSVIALDTSLQTMALNMPYATLTGNGTVETPYVLTVGVDNVGIISDGAYLKNVTMFAKTVSNGYRKITLYNAMAENDFELKAVPKGEGEISLEFHAHWDMEEDGLQENLFKIETAAGIVTDTIKPTIITVPLDADIGVIVSSSMTAVFSEDIRQQDIIADNFMVIKVSDGTIVAGALTYVLATKTVTFTPTVSLDALTDYMFTVARVRDIAGNVMLPVIVNFITA